MAQIEVVAQRVIEADPADVRDAVADYRGTHRRILTEQYTDYDVREGGDGAGTVLSFRFHATSRRVRECLVDVTEPDDTTLVETDRNSTLVTTWTVAAGPRPGTAQVTVRGTWEGAGGVGGFFERLFAPRALRASYARVLANLAAETGAPEGA